MKARTTIALAAVGLASAALALHHARRLRSARPIELPAEAELRVEADAPTISFIVAAWNAEAELPHFVAAFRALRYPNKQLVLCAGGKDRSFEVARSLAGPDVSVVEQRPGEGKQRGLRKSLPEVRGQVIVLTDIDCRPDDETLEPLIAPLLSGAAQATTGTVRPLDEQAGSPFVASQWAIARFVGLHAPEQVGGLQGANAALTREALRASGDFAQEAPSGTDYTLARELGRAGIPIRSVKASQMATEFPPDFMTYRKKQARWLRNVALLGARYGAWHEVRGLLPTLAMPFALGGLLAAGLLFWPLAWLALALYAHMVLNRLHYARRVGLPASLPGAAQTALADLAAGAQATAEIARRRMTWS